MDIDETYENDDLEVLQEYNKIIERDYVKQIVAYVDGSYNKTTQKIGGGIVLLLMDEFYEVRHVLINPITCGESWESMVENPKNPKNEDFLAMHQVGGEIDSALAAAHTAMSVGLPITIVYDYLGVEMWATGEWKRNKPFTQKYHHLMNIYITPVIDVTFEKVKSHTGIQFNDLADVLAKYACDVINGEALLRYFNSHGYELHPVAWVGPDENDTDHEIVYLELVETSKE